MNSIKLELTVQFESRWHAGSGEAGFAAHRLIRRDARNWPFIPGSTLKGIIRENCEKLSRLLGFPAPADPHQPDLTQPGRFVPLNPSLSPVDNLFGNNYEEGGLIFRDSRLREAPIHENINYTRIQRYRCLKTAKEQHLFATEYIRPLMFQTVITGLHPQLAAFSDSDIPYAYCLLIAAILQVERLGGDKSSGSGKVRITIQDPFLYNSQSFPLEQIFEYLDGEIIADTYSLGNR